MVSEAGHMTDLSPSGKKNVLFIAPLPPPVTGHALASHVLLKELKLACDVEVVNVSKSTFIQGFNSISRALQVVEILLQILKKQKKADVIYLTIPQSLAGNIKDLITYLICFKKLAHMVIHLHGGGIKKVIFDNYPLLRYMNRSFLKHIGAAVVLGDSLKSIFRGMVPEDRIHIVPNFAVSSLLADKETIKKKFAGLDPVRILFLSNLIKNKGHNELVDAYKLLDDKLQSRVRIEIAGGFESEEQKKEFLGSIEGIKGITYHGTVSGRPKKELLSGAHLFCLPTYNPYEGQPISILEAYASGCVVLTTDQGGIRDVFKHELNGFFLEKKSPVSIKKAIENVVHKQRRLLDIALYNRELAEQFTETAYISSLRKIICKTESSHN